MSKEKVVAHPRIISASEFVETFIAFSSDAKAERPSETL
jgi:hypothetical protein